MIWLYTDNHDRILTLRLYSFRFGDSSTLNVRSHPQPVRYLFICYITVYHFTRYFFLFHLVSIFFTTIKSGKSLLWWGLFTVTFTTGYYLTRLWTSTCETHLPLSFHFRDYDLCELCFKFFVVPPAQHTDVIFFPTFLTVSHSSLYHSLVYTWSITSKHTQYPKKSK